MSNEYKPKQGDVVKTGIGGHCKDGVAVVSWDNSDKVHVYIDTYWGYNPTRVYPHPLEVKLLFNLRDVREVDSWEFNKYSPQDRYQLNCEHGYRTKYYVKKRAAEDIGHQLTEARKKQQEA